MKAERNPVKLFDDIGLQLAQGLNIVNGAREVLRLPVDKQNADFFAHLSASSAVICSIKPESLPPENETQTRVGC
ncbi:hypothetical protein ACLK17_03310 [Escherichia coli]